MSHHFDTPTAKEDPRINVCDFYLFEGTLGATTVMAMTVNPDAGLSAPDTFRDEGLYAFRFDLNGDATEELTFKFRFGEVRHADGDEHRHIQNFEVLRATGEGARRGAEGSLLLAGETGQEGEADGVRAFAGLAPELFAGNAAGLRAFIGAFYGEGRFHAEAFQNGRDFFAHRNVSAIVLEVPNCLIGNGNVTSWATASLVGHAPEVQVSRWGLPLVTHLFFNDPAKPEAKEQFNRAVPAEDRGSFLGDMTQFIETMTARAGSVEDPARYGREVAERLCPAVLPYKIGTEARFEPALFNGRPLATDAMDVMLNLITNRALDDGAKPDTSRVRGVFPYYGEPYHKAEQEFVIPAVRK